METIRLRISSGTKHKGRRRHLKDLLCSISQKSSTSWSPNISPKEDSPTRYLGYTMKEVHKGVCRIHIKERALTRKIVRAGYYWSTLKKDCTKFVKRCDKCQ
ncbi:hypothetical protein CR513_15437, partial [Mucuna pruriens]